MFDSLTLPVFFLAILIVAFLFLVHRFGGIYWMGIGIVVAAMLSPPAFVGIMAICDYFRYGEFQYKDTSRLQGTRIDLPNSATSITVHCYYSGHAARFNVTEPDLHQWMGAQFQKSMFQTDWESFHKDSLGKQISMETRQLRWSFEDWGWKLPHDAIEYVSAPGGNRSNTQVWYSPSLKCAFLKSAYW